MECCCWRRKQSMGTALEETWVQQKRGVPCSLPGRRVFDNARHGWSTRSPAIDLVPLEVEPPTHSDIGRQHPGLPVERTRCSLVRAMGLPGCPDGEAPRFSFVTVVGYFANEMQLYAMLAGPASAGGQATDVHLVSRAIASKTGWQGAATADNPLGWTVGLPGRSGLCDGFVGDGNLKD